MANDRARKLIADLRDGETRGTGGTRGTRGTRGTFETSFGAKSRPFVLALPARDLHLLSHCFLYVRAGRAGRAGFNNA
jgi:hypothetical protein